MPQTLRECLLLIPCSGLEEFPESIASSDSAQLLDGWLALWHPSLIAQTHAAPRWQSADQPPHDFQGVLAVAPQISRERLPSDSAGTAERGGGWLFASDRPWRSLQSDWLTRLPADGVPIGQLPAAMAAKWQTEFAALGYAYLQIQFLTRQLRYTSNLDQILFDGQLDQAAAAALLGDVPEAEKMLQSCFDQLGQERDHYYSLDVSLLDVTLLAPTTLGTAVEQQLARDQATTFVASGDLLRQMCARHPAAAGELKKALDDHRVSVAGGLDIERPHPLMSFDALERDLARGRQAYRALGFQPPRVFTRFSYGQLSDMPLHLRRSGFVAAMLIAWQDGVYPAGSHAKFSWEASEGTFLNAVAPPLADANDAATFLTLGRRIAEALDHQHVPVFMLAHWPNTYSPFFELLLQVVARTPALGRWQNVDDFFEKTDQPYHQEHLPPRKFQYDWLSPSRGIEPASLIAHSIAYQRLAAQLRNLQNVLNLSYQLENFHSAPLTAKANDPAVTAVSAAARNGEEAGQEASEVTSEPEAPRALTLQELEPALAEAADGVDAIFDAATNNEDHTVRLQASLDRLTAKVGERFAKAAGHQPAASGASASAKLVINTRSAPQRLPLATPTDLAPVAGANWLYATGRTASERLSLIDVPGYAVVRVPLRAPGISALRRERTLVQNDSLLINDFLEVQVDPRTGSLRSVHVPGKRGNRLSIQLARREKTGGGTEYSQAQATSVRAIENTSVIGTVRAQGQLFFRDSVCGQFEIDYELVRGSRILAITVRLDALASLGGSAWTSAYVLRTAWPNESAVLTSRNCGSRQSWGGGKTVAPSLIEIDEADYRTHLLTGGLPFHQRVEQRFMETILSAGSASTGQFRLGVGVDLPNPVVSAQQFLTPPLLVPVGPTVSQSDQTPAPAAWLMHVDAKHAVMELEAPLVDQSGCCVGMRVHLSETAGKSVTARIRALREMSEAHRVDYLGGRVAKLTVQGDTASIALRPNEMTFVDLLWQ